MKKIISWFKNIDRATIIRNSFLVPILSVVVISISHVISWYDLGNPFSWAIYLSVAVEIFALASVSAASIKIRKGSIWLLFILVTLIQIIGNVFFIFQYIDVNGQQFKSWVELLEPWFEEWSAMDHRRLLALIQGGTLPFMSLIALHFYIKFNENLDSGKNEVEITPPVTPSKPDSPDTNDSNGKDEDVFLDQGLTGTEENSVIEKKTDNDQIHIIDKSSRNRRRLHPASY